MSRAVSIHIGVNVPGCNHRHRNLSRSETVAWRMAELANAAGYDSLHVLRGQDATRAAVHGAITGMAGVLTRDDILFISYSGHGGRETDREMEERSGMDQGWCLADGLLLDDKLAGFWRLFDPGVRILIVSDSCYGGGVVRDDQDERPGAAAANLPVSGPVVYRDEDYRDAGYRDGGYRDAGYPGGSYRDGGYRNGRGGYRNAGLVAAADYAGSCIGEPPADAEGIQASVLLIAAADEKQEARDGVFSDHLMAVWDDGRFRGSYCDLHREVHRRVTHDNSRQEPQIFMFGAADPGFPLETAFHLDRHCGPTRGGYDGYR